MNSWGLPQRTIDEISAYFRSKSEINKVILYGSRAKGTFHNGSDIDFAILADENTNFSQIAGELDELSTPYKFDVTDYNSLSNEHLKNSIDKDGIVFYEE